MYLRENILMKTPFLLLFLFAMFSRSVAQDVQKTRGNIQQQFIIGKFIAPQLKMGKGLIVTKDETLDSLFKVIETSWKEVAADSLKRNPMNVSANDFQNIDAYSYFWTLMSIAANPSAMDKVGEHLINRYMVPAMRRDYETIRKHPSLTNIMLVHSGTLYNTIGIGTGEKYSKQTFLSCYKLYQDFNILFQSIGSNDTAVHHYATEQLFNINRLSYDIDTKHSLYTGRIDQAYTSFLTGILTDQYPKSRIKRTGREILDSLESRGKADQSLALLNSLTLNTTGDNLNRDTLLNWYVRLSKTEGKKMYSNVMNKLSSNPLKITELHIKLPENWIFLTNGVPAEKLKKVKYILIDFWETACGPCLEEIPELNALHEKIKSRDDIMLISVNADLQVTKRDYQYVLERSKALNIKFPIFYDTGISNLGKQLKVNSYPSKFILNINGDILTKLDNSPNTLESFQFLVNQHL